MLPGEHMHLLAVPTVLVLLSSPAVWGRLHKPDLHRQAFAGQEQARAAAGQSLRRLQADEATVLRCKRRECDVFEWTCWKACEYQKPDGKSVTPDCIYLSTEEQMNWMLERSLVDSAAWLGVTLELPSYPNACATDETCNSLYVVQTDTICRLQSMTDCSKKCKQLLGSIGQGCRWEIVQYYSFDMPRLLQPSGGPPLSMDYWKNGFDLCGLSYEACQPGECPDPKVDEGEGDGGGEGEGDGRGEGEGEGTGNEGGGDEDGGAGTGRDDADDQEQGQPQPNLVPGTPNFILGPALISTTAESSPEACSKKCKDDESECRYWSYCSDQDGCTAVAYPEVTADATSEKMRGGACLLSYESPEGDLSVISLGGEAGEASGWVAGWLTGAQKPFVNPSFPATEGQVVDETRDPEDSIWEAYTYNSTFIRGPVLLESDTAGSSTECVERCGASECAFWTWCPTECWVLTYSSSSSDASNSTLADGSCILSSQPLGHSQMAASWPGWVGGTLISND